MKKQEVVSFLKKPSVQWISVVLLLLIAVSMAANIRVSNLDLLKDSTSGEYIPLALDPYYFLRVAETINEQGELPAYDEIRYSPLYESSWHPEIMPAVIVGMYNVFNPVFPGSLAYYDVISPVIFFVIGMLLFFGLVYVLTKKKVLALLASLFLAFNPAYLYRTMAGFSDHESIGMMAFFLALLIYSISLIYVESHKRDDPKGPKKRSPLWCALVGGAVTGIVTTFTIAAWGGIANFLFMIVPLSFFLFWVFHVKDKKSAKENSAKSIAFYVSWIVFTILSAPLFAQSFLRVFNFFMSSSNIVSLAIFGFIVVDALLIYFPFKQIKKNLRVLYSLGLTTVLGFVGLFTIGRNPFGLVKQIIQYLINPFAEGRFGATVAENAQPFLQDWINNVGPYIFWMFLLGTILFGVYLAKKVKNKKHSFGMGLAYVLMIVGIVFSKYSASSMLNGDNFISQAFYLVSLAVFWIYFFYLYFNHELNWNARDGIIFGLAFYVIISGRAASRVFFAITPIMCFLAAYFVVNMFSEWRGSKEETLRMTLVVVFVIGLIVSAIAISASYSTIEYTAARTGPSANAQWQGAMGWIRNNTAESAVLSHWWDYGYWVQTLGDRRSIADGGHFQGAEDGNHKIGRYVLTTQSPDTAYSYSKSMNISHLLIDQTDLGKYGAYSKIGSDVNWDRFSSITIGTYDASKITETKDTKAFVYNIQGFVDEDIKYDSDGDGKTDIFLPGPTFNELGNPSVKAYVIGVIYSMGDNTAKQPKVVYYYNGQQIEIPARYIYYNGQLLDFKTGIDSVIYVFSGVSQSQTGISIDPIGAAIYLSPKVQKSLFARAYLMNNAFGDYDDLTLVHSENDPVVNSLNSQGANVGDFVYYQGFRGPIKIWEAGYPSDTQYIKEFPEKINYQEAGFGSLDKLF